MEKVNQVLPTAAGLHPIPEKKVFVQNMFDSIAARYDLLNHLLSFNIDTYWRKKMVQQLQVKPGDLVLDLATGTGDVAIEIVRQTGANVQAIDISRQMLSIGEKKVKEKGMMEKISFTLGDAEEIGFPDGFFDGITIAFGIRNVSNIPQSLRSMRRVLQAGHFLVILEFSKPKSFPVKQFYTFYSNYVIPLVGKIISGNQSAYHYLPKSVQQFPDGNEFAEIIKDAGFDPVRYFQMSLGIVTIYVGTKS